ncbi:DUF1178 family protein [Pseudohalocynthiibacter aestuariivivens]|uniref:DUF1178 family protein n=1 Tax=Roseovarius pelagicus TaxID=2980108 RepID=A0ABY6DD93_9RHOB|nr:MULTISPECIES: DUF1178 family protein [Rhodobacterales]QIE45100.1 DUF1178 family protein [Pseudohalocynthiibacter aestuariivivens]UXX82963.1 DUF1178 family protein [Roseovarius pelagicus]
MIKFTLKCAEGHQFDSWFHSTATFDKLDRTGMVTCAICGGTDVEKAMMAPTVQAGRKRAANAPEQSAQGTLSAPASPAEQALARLRQEIESNSEYVGHDFAREARDIHDGNAPERAIYGEAKPEDAKKLIEDGVPVTPLPFRAGRKSN